VSRWKKTHLLQILRDFQCQRKAYLFLFQHKSRVFHSASCHWMWQDFHQHWYSFKPALPRIIIQQQRAVHSQHRPSWFHCLLLFLTVSLPLCFSLSTSWQFDGCTPMALHTHLLCWPAVSLLASKRCTGVLSKLSLTSLLDPPFCSG